MKRIDLIRRFIYKNGNTEIPLTDIDPSMAPNKVVEFYANTYPELINGKAGEAIPNGKYLDYKVSVNIGYNG